MSQVYITNASLNQISKSLRTKRTNISRTNMIEDISSDFSIDDIISEQVLNELFHNSDLKDIYFMKKVLKDFSELLENIQGNKEIITEHIINSNKQYAYTTKAPSYHKDSQCQWMLKGFSNIEIPQECIQNKQMEQKAKQWILKFKNLPFEELNNRFKIEFNCSVGLLQIDRKNSGSISFENQEIQFEFNTQIKTKYKQLRFFLDGEFADKLKNLKFAPSFKIQQLLKNDADTNSHQTILEFHEVKDALKQIIFDFYKNKYNAELKFESTILDSIGFNSCRGCN